MNWVTDANGNRCSAEYFAAISIVLLTIVVFCGGILLVDVLVASFKKRRDIRDRRIRNHAVGAFSGVKDHQKRWQSE